VNAAAAVAGLPGPSSSGSAPPSQSAAPKVVLGRVQRIRTALKKGVRARCTAGTCRVTVERGGKALLRGAGASTVVAKPTAAGRKLLRRGRSFTAVAILAVDGGSTRHVKVTFKP
jgi:hypothetical protein